MKRKTLCFVLMATLLAGCRYEKKEFTTRNLSGEQCFLMVFDQAVFDDIDTVGLSISYSVAWPEQGLLSPGALHELRYLTFCDSTAPTVEEAVERWKSSLDFFFDDESMSMHEVDSLDFAVRFYSYYNLESTCRQDSDLAVFAIMNESYHFGAAHGLHSADYLTVDKETGNAIHLTDLVADTNLLCEAVARAIQDLDVNKETRECLFDEFKAVDRMPMPRNFTVDSARNNITVYYGLYEIACYACDIQQVVLPIYWLSKHVPLTPYAKRLFGPEGYIEEGR